MQQRRAAPAAVVYLVLGLMMVMPGAAVAAGPYVAVAADASVGSPLTAPQSVHVREDHYGSFEVTWEPPASQPEDGVTGYRVTTNGTNVDYPPTAREARAFVWRGTEYTIEVAALDQGTVGPAVTFTGRASEAPEFSIATTRPDLEAGTLTYTWTDPVVEPRLTPTGWHTHDGKQHVELPLSARSFTLQDLELGDKTFATVCLDVVNLGGYCEGVPVTFGRIASAPTDLAFALDRGGDYALSWSAPSDLGHGGLLFYEWSIDGGPWHYSERLSVLPSGVKTGSTYQVAVRAVTEAGLSESAVGEFTLFIPPKPVPNPPTSVRGSSGDQKIEVQWTAPSTGPRIVRYVVTSSPGGLRREVVGARTSVPITGLSNGTPYTFQVASISGASVQSEASEPSEPVVPAGRPAQVGSVKAQVKKRKLRLTWARAFDNGAPILSYTVTAGSRELVVDGSKREVTLKRLAPGRYRVRIVAANMVGTSRASDAIVVRMGGR